MTKPNICKYIFTKQSLCLKMVYYLQKSYTIPYNVNSKLKIVYNDFKLKNRIMKIHINYYICGTSK